MVANRVPDLATEHLMLIVGATVSESGFNNFRV